jgi:two-component system, cell cycle sensor histidine kinase and response regulator CckA
VAVTEEQDTKKRLMDELAAARERVVDLERSVSALTLTERSLRTGEEWFRKLVDNARDTIFRMRLPDGRYEYVSSASTALSGYTPEEFYANPLLIAKIIDPAFSGLFREKWEELIEGRAEPSYEYKITHRSGEKRWLYQTNVLVRDESGRAIALEGVVTDITERKMMEEALRENEERFRSLLEATSDWVWQMDRDNIYTYASPKVRDLLGYDPEEIIGKAPFDLMPGPEAERIGPLFMDITRDHRPFSQLQNLNIRKDGRLIMIETSGTPLFDRDGSYAGYLGFDRDITERREAEESLKRAEQKYHAIFDNAIMGIFQTSPEGRILSANRAFARNCGYSSPEEMMETIKDIGKEQYVREEDRARLHALCREKGYVEGFETTFRRKDGSTLWASMNVREVRNEEGAILYYEGTAENITERKRAEEALRRSELKNRTLLESISDGVYILDTEGRFTFVNEVIAKRSGHPVEWFTGRYYLDVIRPEYREMAEKSFRRHVAGEFLPPYEIALSYPEASPTGIWVEVHNRPLFDGTSVVGVLGISRDITARKQMEAELLKKRTLESIGTLAGGIAHDFNNLLMAVTGYISIAKLALPVDSEEFGFLKEAERISLGGKELTRKLIAFSEGGISSRKTLSLGDLVKDSSPLALTGSNIECLYAIPDTLFPVEADELQIGQAIHNIVLNAREAMPEGGTVEIEGTNVTLTGEENLPLPPGDYARISIKDRGKGIRAEDLPKIFDPYFTTKGMGAERGMGLGLAVAYSAIKRHNGHVIVDSLLNKGTTVHIYLPAHKDGVIPATPVSPLPEKKILFMDDDDNVRTIGGKLITHLGYKVALASNGNEALALYTHALDSHEPFDAVILDLTIKGGMGGKEAFDRIRAIDPSIKAIISSGYTDDPAISRYREYGFKGVMTKPYKVEELRELLKEVTG